MKNFTVTLVHVIGYNSGNVETPNTKSTDYEVTANTEAEAIQKAKAMDTTLLSVYESYVS